ncbi:hypothetical protein [Aliiroseovarius subalbicans]|uniref:hypothetical protein n=1 Tax=Aliiroseovarius subalbicans TaxID=2925840 RepID=UPI001F59B11D|nr:hypothetical protein [Aliiroseovarius subalbicans]MCI2398174.1 hypothetical protein [Aliiroseovarius subalbicans]
MASKQKSKPVVEAPQHPRYVRADRPVHERVQPVKNTKLDPKDAPVIYSDWASI